MPFYIVIDMVEHKISFQIELRQNKLDIREASNGI
jgi:hypothetical protein